MYLIYIVIYRLIAGLRAVIDKYISLELSGVMFAPQALKPVLRPPEV